MDYPPELDVSDLVLKQPVTVPPVNAKPRYDLLDGLRGVAALFVIWYHFFEGFASSAVDQMLNHGYLAVDFFFVLSGFVIGYAYDGSWRRGMTSKRFILRRVVRLQPMVVLSVILGAISFLIQGSCKWDGSPVAPHDIIIALIAGFFLIPLILGVDADVRGNGEMFPLNGPSWSLFFEYIGSILYAMTLRRLTDRQLAVVVVISGAALASWAMTDMSGAYNLGVGWSMADFGLIGGFLRVSFSFSVGLLMQRRFKARHVRGAFWLCTFIIAVVLSCPYVGGSEKSVLNGIYDSICTLFVFPLVVYLGACGRNPGGVSGRLCEFLGRLSYPVYIVHYPVMYLFYAWVWTDGLTWGQVWPVCCILFVGIVVLAWLALRFYDEPVRRYLTGHILNSRSADKK